MVLTVYVAFRSVCSEEVEGDVVRWLKHCGICGEEVEAFGAAVVRRLKQLW